MMTPDSTDFRIAKRNNTAKKVNLIHTSRRGLSAWCAPGGEEEKWKIFPSLFQEVYFY